MEISNEQQVVIVTGAGRGIGKGIAKRFAQEGKMVILAEIDKESGELVEKEITEEGLTACFIQTDIASTANIADMIKEVELRFGRIDILINNAGVSKFADPLELTEELWNNVIDTNLKGTFFCSREAVNVMKKNGGGSIVNISSTRALMSEPNSEAYAASKGGILALTHAMAASFSKYHVQVNAILPGWIETGDYNALKHSDHEQHFSRRVGLPEDIANACVFLTDKKSTFTTGTQLIIDGGMTRKMIYEE